MRWGIIFTNYDALVFFSTEATREVGQWDVSFSHYTSDLDYYHRMKAAGFYTGFVSPGLVLHHVSGTLRSSLCYARRISELKGYARSYYRAKWGGGEDAETYSHPFQYDVKREELAMRSWVVTSLLACFAVVAWHAGRKIFRCTSFVCCASCSPDALLAGLFANCCLILDS